MPLKALIFDFDGVILDSETPEYHTWLQICARYGVDIPLETWEKGLGSSLDAFDPIMHLEKTLGKPVDYDALLREQKNLLNESLKHQPPLPGVKDYLNSAKAAGVKIAVASSSPLAWVAGNLRRLLLWEFFDVVCTQEDVRSVKPDPDLFLLALERLAVLPEQAVVIEDSPNGILAARRAGIFVIAVPTPISSQLDLSQANLILPSLNALPLENLMQRFL